MLLFAQVSWIQREKGFPRWITVYYNEVSFSVWVIIYNLYRVISNKSIQKFGWLVWLFASNKRQNVWTDRAQICITTHTTPQEGLWIDTTPREGLWIDTTPQEGLWIDTTRQDGLWIDTTPHPRKVYGWIYTTPQERLMDRYDPPGKAYGWIVKSENSICNIFSITKTKKKYLLEKQLNSNALLLLTRWPYRTLKLHVILKWFLLYLKIQTIVVVYINNTISTKLYTKQIDKKHVNKRICILKGKYIKFLHI